MSPSLVILKFDIPERFESLTGFECWEHVEFLEGCMSETEKIIIWDTFYYVNILK